MDAQVEEQVRAVIEAIRTACRQPQGFDHRALADLTDRVKAAKNGPTMRERRAFLDAVGVRLQEEAGPSRNAKIKGLAGTHRVFDDPDGDTIHTFGMLLTKIAKQR